MFDACLFVLDEHVFLAAGELGYCSLCRFKGCHSTWKG